MFKRFLLVSSLFLATPVFGATICVEIADEQLPYVQAVALREKSESAQTYLQGVVTSAVNSWKKQLDDEKLQKMKEMLQALPVAVQVQLITALETESQEEKTAQTLIKDVGNAIK